MDVKKIAVQTAKRYQTWNPYEIARARDVQIIYAPLKSILGRTNHICPTKIHSRVLHKIQADPMHYSER